MVDEEVDSGRHDEAEPQEADGPEDSSATADPSGYELLPFVVAWWLNYQSGCGRSNIFREDVLVVPISEFLGQIHGYDNVQRECPLRDVLREGRSGDAQERRPLAYDFAVVRKGGDGNPQAVFETKWHSGGGTNAAGIVTDLLKLAAARAAGVERFFILAGRSTALDPDLTAAGDRGRGRPRSPVAHLLPKTGGKGNTVDAVHLPEALRLHFEKELKHLRGYFELATAPRFVVELVGLARPEVGNPQ